MRFEGENIINVLPYLFEENITRHTEIQSLQRIRKSFVEEVKDVRYEKFCQLSENEKKDDIGNKNMYTKRRPKMTKLMATKRRPKMTKLMATKRRPKMTKLMATKRRPNVDKTDKTCNDNNDADDNNDNKKETKDDEINGNKKLMIVLSSFLNKYSNVGEITNDVFIDILFKIAPDNVKTKCINIARDQQLNGKSFIIGTDEYINPMEFSKLFYQIQSWNDKHWMDIHKNISEKLQYGIIMKDHIDKIQKLKKKITNFEHKFIHLYEFVANDISNVIQWCIYNDIKYKKLLHRTMEIFSTYSLTGNQINEDAINALSSLMTKTTFNISLNLLTGNQNDEKIQDITPQKMGYEFYNVALNELVTKIRNENIDGKEFIVRSLQEKDWIADVTGWSPIEVYHISSALFAYYVPSKMQPDYIHNILRDRLEETLAIEIKDSICSKFVVKELYHNIINGYNIETFSDMMINLVDKLTSSKSSIESKNTLKIQVKTDHDESESIIRDIFEAVADCFLFNSNSKKMTEYNLHAQCNWKCFNCGNNNFSNYVKGEIYISDKCVLCGIKRRESLLAAIRNFDTYITGNNTKTDEKDGIADEKQDRFDKLIMKMQDKFSLHCLTQNDNKKCESILRLAKCLLVHNAWMQKLYHGKKTQLSEEKLDLTNNMYKAMFLKCAKSNGRIADDDINSLNKLLNKDSCVEYLKKITNTKQFVKYMKEYTKIKPAQLGKLYRALKYSITFGKFLQYLSDLDINLVDQDYHHVLKEHIDNGTETTIEHLFRFFAELTHYEDLPAVAENCKKTYLERRKQRTNLHHKSIEEQIRYNTNEIDCVNIALLKQYYFINQLDVIHHYFAHTDWKRFAKKQYENDDYSQVQDKYKYVTSSNELVETQNNVYSFGIGYDYSKMGGIYDSIRKEMIFNKVHKLSAAVFQVLVTKAINKHAIALTKHKNKLYCKYYEKEYNILRNAPIGVKHIFTMVTYTDETDFCSAFRSTFRRSGKEEPMERHMQLYNYSRALYESVEFFGTRMSSRSEVYHGLNKPLYFQRFTNFHFNQPLSTSGNTNTAVEFSQGCGLVLTLKSDLKSNDFTGAQRAPKYVSVSWISDFPYEKEKLYHGKNVTFRIVDICTVEGKCWKSHKEELKLLNNFEKLIKNGTVDWNECAPQKMKKLVETQQQINRIDDNKREESVKPTEYEQQLFDCWWNHLNTKQISISNYAALPETIKNILFVEDNTDQFSLIPLIDLFSNLTHLSLIDLGSEEIKQHASEYMSAVSKALVYIQKSSNVGKYMKSITFQSELDDREDSSLKSKVNNYLEHLKRYLWEIKYLFDLYSKHNLICCKMIETTDENYQMESKPIGKWEMFPNLLQVLTVDKDIIKIKFISKAKQKNISTYRVDIKSIKDINDDEKKEEKQEILQMEASEKFIEISANANTTYELGVFLKDHQESNSMIIRTPSEDFDPNKTNYSPCPPSIKSVKQYYDEHKQYILVIWDHPNNAFGDRFIYKIQSSHLQEAVEIEELPYKIPVSVKSVEIKINTISIIAKKRYQGKESDAIYIGV
eukprot:298288_1